MMAIDVITFGYAAAVAIGGIVGYVKAGSTGSLAAGLVFGGLIGLGAYQTSKDPNNFYLAFGTSATLGGVMGYRFWNSGKFMPAGMVAFLSLAMVSRFTVRALTASKH